MDQDSNNKKDNLENLKTFFKKNKIKIIIFNFILFSLLFFYIAKTQFENKKKLNISEKYIKAGLLLSKDKKEESKKIFEEIIFSNSKFYSLLALNIILDKNLIENKEQVLKYFEKVESEGFSDEINDLIIFKKALYLLEQGDIKNGKKLLNGLVNNNSRISSLALELIN